MIFHVLIYSTSLRDSFLCMCVCNVRVKGVPFSTNYFKIKILKNCSGLSYFCFMLYNSFGNMVQVPQFLLDYMWGRGEACKIVCTQPRRISAISGLLHLLPICVPLFFLKLIFYLVFYYQSFLLSFSLNLFSSSSVLVSERISYERGENVGSDVGYKVFFLLVVYIKRYIISYLVQNFILLWSFNEGLSFGHYLEVTDVGKTFLMEIGQDLIISIVVLGACMIGVHGYSCCVGFSWIGIMECSYFIAYFENLNDRIYSLFSKGHC